MTARLALTRALLLAGLLLGLVTMHTLGHPAPAGAPAAAGRAEYAGHAGHAGHGQYGQTSTEDAGGAGPAHDRHAASAAHTGWATDTQAGPARAGGAAGGLDPMAACLAVLGALVLVALGGGHPLARRARPAPHPGRTRRRWGAGRAPPSRTVVLRV
ncbi:hypothetical protein ACIQUQ_06610 [Streptomyces sp. NPDC101118]|uniref:hypothetical protein n=1 Tax=Streptomyces sp. NPDC101118 TaxID=3366109 RepID=UPI00380B5C48